MKSTSERLQSIREKLESLKDYDSKLPIPTNPYQQACLDDIEKEMTDLKDYIDDVIHQYEIRSDKKHNERRINKIKKINKK